MKNSFWFTKLSKKISLTLMSKRIYGVFRKSCRSGQFFLKHPVIYIMYMQNIGSDNLNRSTIEANISDTAGRGRANSVDSRIEDLASLSDCVENEGGLGQ